MGIIDEHRHEHRHGVYVSNRTNEVTDEPGQTVQAVIGRTNADTPVGHCVGQGVQIETDTIRNAYKGTTGKQKSWIRSGHLIR